MNDAVKEVIDNANPIIKRKNFGYAEINNFNYLDRNIYLNSLDYKRSNSRLKLVVIYIENKCLRNI